MLIPIKAPSTVVIVNGDVRERARLSALARQAGHQVIALGTGQAALSALAPPEDTVMVVNRALADMSALDLIGQLHARGVYLPTVVTIPPHAIEDAVNAIRTGAQDVLEEPFGATQFLRSISNAMK